ncbi:MAG: SPOR domain-containing protein [Ignavibacteriae bacterium]|nr:SPOR domain-containing protein [Ignavibacteriota bacterium]
MNENQQLNQPKRPTLHPPDGDPKAKQITLWIVVGVVAIVVVYFLLYSDVFKKEDKPASQVVIPDYAMPQPDTLSEALMDTMYQEDIPPDIIEDKSKPKTAEKKKEPTPEQKEKGSFTINVGTFSKTSLAEKEKTWFIEKGFEAFLVPKEKMFRVSVGKFATRAEAKKVADEIKSTLKKDCWVDELK